MMAYGCSPETPTAGALPHTTATTEASTVVTRLWPAILAAAAVGGSLALTCVAPFAAFAVATAGTLRLRSALGTMAVIWLANQAVGFRAYPCTLNTILWGLAMGAAAVLATLASSGAICMKLSIDVFRTCGGFFVSTQICSQYLRGCPSDSQGLSHQPFSGVTRVGEKAAQCEFRLKDRLHPTRCQCLEMAHEFEQAQLALFRAPEVSTHLWAERICEHNEKHTTVQITQGGVFFGCRENG
jgi:hypothetical protein